MNQINSIYQKMKQGVFGIAIASFAFFSAQCVAFAGEVQQEPTNTVATTSSIERSLETTAYFYFLEENPLAELNAPETLKQVKQIQREIRSLLLTAIKADYHNNFYRPLPFELGIALFQPQNDLAKDLYTLTKATGTVAVDGKFKTSDPKFDAFLAANQISEISASLFASDDLRFRSYSLHFSEEVNPNFVVQAGSALKNLKWIENNGIWLLDGPFTLLRDNASSDMSTSYYTIRFGWGDCPAGCINKYEINYKIEYFEHYDIYLVSKISESGDDLPASFSDVLLNPPVSK